MFRQVWARYLLMRCRSILASAASCIIDTMDSVKPNFYRAAFEHKSNEALVKYYNFAQSAIAEIAANMRSPDGLAEENAMELQASSDKLHSEMGVCAVLLHERGIDINNEGE